MTPRSLTLCLPLLTTILAACFGDDPNATAITDTTADSDAGGDTDPATGEPTATSAGTETSAGPGMGASSSHGTGESESTGEASSDATSDATTGEPIPEECNPIPPSADADENHARITACLEDHGVAILTDGTYPVSATIDVPDGALFKGDQTWPRVTLAAASQALVRTHDGSEVAFLRLDGDHRVTVAHGAVVHVRGSDAFIHDNHIQNADGPTGDDKVTGVRFWTVGQTGNHVFRNQIHHVHYGVIFDLHEHGADNLLEQNTIYEIRCDGVTFRGYGRAVGNDISRCGWQCLNPPEDPIPGGAFYTLGNAAGAQIIDNHSHENCGMSLDLDRSSNLEIIGNTIEKAGFVWDGHDNCGAGQTAHLIDISDSIIEGNTFRNNGPKTVGGDPNKVLSADGSGQPTDLPSGVNQAVAFMLTHREGGEWLTTGNSVRDNKFIANCQAPCVGLGYFVGRGTGYDNQNQWSAQTTNYFTGNDPFGSNIGSRRCGGNWYAADSECLEGMLEPECNIDDPQHQGPGFDWARNDGCNFYD